MNEYRVTLYFPDSEWDRIFYLWAGSLEEAEQEAQEEIELETAQAYDFSGSKNTYQNWKENTQVIFETVFDYQERRERWMNRVMDYAFSKLAAAKELASKPETRNMPSSQNATCREYGVFLDNMTSDEIAEFNRLIEDFTKGRN